MTTAQPSATGGPSQTATRAERVERAEVTGWTGWIAFAGSLMIVLGGLAIIQGLVAILNDNWVVWTNTQALLIDLTAWGWVHLVVGAIIVLAGVGVFTGNVLARAIGVFLACVSIAINFAFIPAFPLWALTIIALDVLVVWALLMHGEEMRA
jgi:hypothetical protein